jgi:hypothetical protein
MSNNKYEFLVIPSTGRDFVIVSRRAWNAVCKRHGPPERISDPMMRQKMRAAMLAEAQAFDRTHNITPPSRGNIERRTCRE